MRVCPGGGGVGGGFMCSVRRRMCLSIICGRVLLICVDVSMSWWYVRG